MPWTFATHICSSKQAQNLHINNNPMRLCKTTSIYSHVSSSSGHVLEIYSACKKCVLLFLPWRSVNSFTTKSKYSFTQQSLFAHYNAHSTNLHQQNSTQLNTITIHENILPFLSHVVFLSLARIFTLKNLLTPVSWSFRAVMFLFFSQAHHSFCTPAMYVLTLLHKSSSLLQFFITTGISSL